MDYPFFSHVPWPAAPRSAGVVAEADQTATSDSPHCVPGPYKPASAAAHTVQVCIPAIFIYYVANARRTLH